MKAAIKKRAEQCNECLFLLRLARETHSPTDFSHAYIGGRICELESEKAFLGELLKEEEDHAGKKEKNAI